MTRRDLAALIADHLDQVTAATVAEIARGVGARDADVRATLAVDNRFVGPFRVGKAPHRRAVYLRPHGLDLAADYLGRAA